MDNTTTSPIVTCTPKNPASGLNTAQGAMPACEGGTIQVTMGMFFDGTGNNKVNVNGPKTGKSEDVSDHASFFNGLSNVARASENYIGSLNGVDISGSSSSNDDNIGGRFNIYIEGIGTNNRANDDGIFGFGLGNHLISGIKPRVQLGTKKAAQAIMEYEEIKNTINTINKIEVAFDVFGFSRGAAAARHFVSENTKPIDTSSPSGLNFGEVFSSPLEFEINQFVENNNKIEVDIHWNFLGLYETVSSHGLDRSDDVGELGLDNLSEVKAGLQIVAEDEYREKFSLTTVNSNQNIAVIKLPGVHSDIGGGYSDNYINGTQEKDYVLYLIRFGNRLNLPSKPIAKTNINVVRKWFIDNGWYKDDSRLIIEEKDPSGQTSGHFILKATRTGIKNTYSHIPLHIMTKQAIANGVNFDTILLSSYRIESGILSKIYNSGSSGVNLNTLNSDELLTFRYEYLHWSSRLFTKAGGHDPRIVDSEPNYPKYKRETHSG